MEVELSGIWPASSAVNTARTITMRVPISRQRCLMIRLTKDNEHVFQIGVRGGGGGIQVCIFSLSDNQTDCSVSYFIGHNKRNRPLCIYEITGVNTRRPHSLYVGLNNAGRISMKQSHCMSQCIQWLWNYRIKKLWLWWSDEHVFCS